MASLGAFATPASADATNLNSCQYSYDDYWRDMDVTFGGTPSVAAAQSGETISLDGLTVSAALPDWMAQYGYNFGLLQSGENEIPVTVWAAVRGTNTTQGTLVYEVDTTATTTITTSGGDFVGATPIRYDIPPMGATQWTARGGPVAFSQAGSGALPQLPVGPGGRLQKPRGSVYIQASLGAATLGLDCVPGTYLAQGSERQEQAPSPFAAVDVGAFDCLGAVPAATSVAPVKVGLVPRRGLAAATAGAAYAFAPSVSYRLPNAYLSQLYDAGLLAEGDNAVTGTLTAAIDASSRAILAGPAQTATVRVSAGGTTISVIGDGGETDDLAGIAELAAGSWTPAANVALGFAAAAPGALGALSVDGIGQPVRPYGSVYVRLAFGGSPARRLSLDCVSGRVSVAPGTPPAYSELGDQVGGDQGRYSVNANQLDPFASAHLVPGATATPTPTPVATATATPTPPPAATASPTPVATGTPAATVVPAARAVTKVESTRLKVSGTGVSVSLSCTGNATCKGTLTLKTASKLKLGKKAKRIITLAGTVKYSVAAGKSASVRMTLSKDGRSLLKTHKKVSVRLAVKPASGSASSKALTLSK